MKSIFVSHVYEDRKYLNKILRWEDNGLLESYRITHEKGDKRPEGKKAIDVYLKKMIRGAAIVLVLVGDNTHNHDWIRREVELAANFNKQILCMRIPETTGKKPKILNNYEEIVFDPSKLLYILEND